VPIVLKSRSLNFLEPSGPVKACNGLALPLPFLVCDDHVAFVCSAQRPFDHSMYGDRKVAGSIPDGVIGIFH
jgi:hypothetical protein